jgi:hypothetical protein
MSYPNNDWLERFHWTMQVPIPKGTVVSWNWSEEEFEILEDTTAHGSPLVRSLKTGKESHKLLNLHIAIAEAVSKPQGGACPHSLILAEKYKK